MQNEIKPAPDAKLPGLVAVDGPAASPTQDQSNKKTLDTIRTALADQASGPKMMADVRAIADLAAKARGNSPK